MSAKNGSNGAMQCLRDSASYEYATSGVASHHSESEVQHNLEILLDTHADLTKAHVK